MLGGVIGAALQELERVEVRPALCTLHATVHGARTDCSACVDVCSTGALTLDPLAVDADRCDGCGLCAGACPTGALTPTPAARRELIVGLRAARRGRPFSMACGLAGPAAAPSMRLRCPATLGWEGMLLPLLLGVSELRLRTGRCGHCRLHAAGPRIERHRQTAGRIAAALGLGDISIEPDADHGGDRPAAGDPPRAILTRRGLFTAALQRGKSVAAVAARRLGPDPTGEDEAPGGVGPVEAEQGAAERGRWPRALVAALLARLDLGALPLEGLHDAGRPRVDEQRCDPCPICAAACPTGALRLRKDDDGRALALWGEACAGCGACVQVCPEGALRMAAAVDLAEWGTGAVDLIAPRRIACHACGDDALSARLPLCPRCHRRAPPAHGGGTTRALLAEEW